MDRNYYRGRISKWLICLAIVVYYISIYFLWGNQSYAAEKDSGVVAENYNIGKSQFNVNKEKLSSALDSFSNYTLEKFPFHNSKSSKIIKLYKKALENEDDLIALQLSWSGYGYKTTDSIYSTDYLYYGDIKKGKPSGQGVVFKHGSPIYMGNFLKGYPSTPSG